MKRSLVLAAIVLLVVFPTAFAAAGLHIVSITTGCKSGVGVGGEATFNNDSETPVTRDVTFSLWAHFPPTEEKPDPAGTWEKTGDQVVVHVVDIKPGESVTLPFEMSSSPQPGANSYRVENDLDTEKSVSWPGCTPNAVTVSAFSATRETLWPIIGLFVLLVGIAVFRILFVRGVFRIKN